MSKSCAKCDRAVYPLEELKCLDKVWHKACFKCQECGMTLSMRNYKGFNRLPYCTAHCPQAKHTTVADTPEIRRIQENTKIQSTVKYHEEFEKQKGKVTQIADDPETLRIKQNTRIISNVAYHGELERKAAMEQKRPMAEGFEDGNMDQPYSGKFEFVPVCKKTAAFERVISSEFTNLDQISINGSTTSLNCYEYDLTLNQEYPGSEFKIPKISEMPIDDIPTVDSPIVSYSGNFLSVDGDDMDSWSLRAVKGSVDDLTNVNLLVISKPAYDVLNAHGIPLSSPMSPVSFTIDVSSPGYE